MAAKKKTKTVTIKPVEPSIEEKLTHKTKEIAIKKGNVDIEMIPVVNWLNSFEGVITWYCCEGYTKECQTEMEKEGYGIDDKPYILFQCSDEVSLINILSKLGAYGETNVSFFTGYVRYTTRFSNKEYMYKFIERVCKEK